MTKVLADAMAKRAATVTTRDTSVWGRREGQFTIAAIPPDIADRLERALDVCQHRFDADGEPCEFPERAIAHHNPFGHPFTPLVQP